MPSVVAVTILLFGLTALGAGLNGLFQAAQQAQSFSASSPATQATNAYYLAATAMGLYYPLMAYQENRVFFLATVPMRLLSTTVFWLQQWKAASIWEGVEAIVTAMAILWDRRRTDGRTTIEGQGKRAHKTR